MSDVTLSQTTKFSSLSRSTQSAHQYPQSSASLEVTHDYDNDEGLLSADVYLRAVPLMDQTMLALQVTGLALNIINIIVMTRRSMRSPTTTFLVAVSALQLMYITFGFIRSVQRIIEPALITDIFYLVQSLYVSRYFMSCIRRSMYCIQCCVSIERFLAVWLPLKAKQFLLVRRPWLFIFAIPALVFLADIHVLLKFDIFETTSPQNHTIHSFRYSQHYLRHPEIFKYWSFITKTIFAYLTLVMLITINLAMTGIIKRYASMRRQMKTNMDVDSVEKRETQMTLTILVSSLIFVVLCLPTITSSLAHNAAPKSYGPFSPNRYLFLFMQKVGGILFTLAFCTDVVTYVAISSAYRYTLLNLLKIEKVNLKFFNKIFTKN